MKNRFLEIIRNEAKALKSEMNALMLAYRGERTPIIATILIAVTVAYKLSAIDLIPDFAIPDLYRFLNRF